MCAVCAKLKFDEKIFFLDISKLITHENKIYHNLCTFMASKFSKYSKQFRKSLPSEASFYRLNTISGLRSALLRVSVHGCVCVRIHAWMSTWTSVPKIKKWIGEFISILSSLSFGTGLQEVLADHVHNMDSANTRFQVTSHTLNCRLSSYILQRMLC